MPVIALVAPGPEVTRTTPDFTGGARIAIGHMHGTLLMAHQYVIDASDRMQGIVNIEYRPARISEYVLNALIDQRSDDHLGS
jgi:hypothetical protein